MSKNKQKKTAPQADYIDQANESDQDDVQGGSSAVGLDEIQVDLNANNKSKGKRTASMNKNEASFKSATSDHDF
jgi:hypothetical protein